MLLFKFFMGCFNYITHIYSIIAFLFLHEKKIFNISFSSRNRRICQAPGIKSVLLAVPDDVLYYLPVYVRVPDDSLLSYLLAACLKLRLDETYKTSAFAQKLTCDRKYKPE